MTDVMIEIDWLGGNCPVQAEGTINGKRFYFRARGDCWSLEVSPGADGDYLSWPVTPEPWLYEEDYGDGPFDAGWMPQEEAVQMIAKAAALYAAQAGAPTT
jgi:hypothetical protein